MTTGRILHLQRLSTEDGPGIRTTVFFKGCPLRCAWCHNPESISFQLQTQWYATRCMGCKTCVEVCPNKCLVMAENGLVIDREHCDVCGNCVAACPTAGHEMLGKTVTRDELLAELLKDRVYYEKSGGGITLSGGEPTFQPDFAETLLRGLKELGISAAIDTCGLTSTRTFDRLLPYTDLVLFDLKLLDPILHRKFTGVTNQQILENLAYIQNTIQHQARCIDLWIRTPLIPGATDTDENLTALGKYLSKYLLGTITRWELCAFNNLCREQYIRLGLDWEYATTPLMTQAELLRCEQLAKSAFSQPELVIASGATRQEDLIWE